jgi:hypothetical protein
MSAVESMPRTRVNFRLDDRVLEELEKLAGKGKINQFVEGVLFEFLKNTGRLSEDAKRLPEARGKKKEKATDKLKATPSADTLAQTPADRSGDEPGEATD